MATAGAHPPARALGAEVRPVRGHAVHPLRHLLNRSMVYGALTGIIVLAYASSVVVFRALLPGDIPYAIALMSTGAAALLVLPLRDRLQRAANRLLYGDRDDPYRALSRLGGQLEVAAAAGDVPTVVVATVADALRLPFVRIELVEDDRRVAAATHGRPPQDPAVELLHLPLLHAGTTIGELVLAPRGPGERFNEADRRLLHDLARQAGPAIAAGRLMTDLRRSRERLVATREEERRRLRRELHDGVGPTLAGTLMKLEAARTRLPADPAEANSLLADLAGDTRRTIDEVRRLTHELRPPALDELGLVGAVREQAARFVPTSIGGPSIEVDAPRTLGTLPAAVEVAAYRIAIEGLTNVVRHSHAMTGRVRMAAIDGELVVEIKDDGTGIHPSSPDGVGMRSMRERAEELGGSLAIIDGRARGTTVRARLPLRRDDA